MIILLTLLFTLNFSYNIIQLDEYIISSSAFNVASANRFYDYDDDEPKHYEGYNGFTFWIVIFLIFGIVYLDVLFLYL